MQWHVFDTAPFDGGHWLVKTVSFDGVRGWRFEIEPVPYQARRMQLRFGMRLARIRAYAVTVTVLFLSFFAVTPSDHYWQ